jgi:hypothetical protein
MTDPIEGEIVTETDLVVREPAAPAPVGLFNTDDPDITLARSVKVADVLKDVITKKKLVLRIGQSEYIKVEGWTTLGALVGLFAQTEWTRPLDDNAGWEAAVVVKNGQGFEFGRAEAQCLRSEKNWKNRDDFALRSMAQTRAMGKALRMPLGFIAVLAGYEATPAEEMPAQQVDDIPFEDGPAQGPPTTLAPNGDTRSGTGGAETHAADRDVTALLELAAKVSPEAHDKALEAIVKHRDAHGGQVDAGWLVKQLGALRKKLPDEAEQSSFADKIPESARK